MQLTHSSSPEKNDKQLKPVQGKAIEDNRHRPAIQKKANKTGLPEQLKNGIENLSGISMEEVNVHYGSSKPAKVQAHAYAQGNEIHVGPGQEKHLPHEAWHVVQQKQGRVKPTVQMKGNIKINDDKGLEKEADTMGQKAARGNFIPPMPMQQKKTSGSTPSTGNAGSRYVLQLARWKWDDKKGKWIDMDKTGEHPPEFEGEYHGEVYDDEPRSKKRKKTDDGTYKGARTFGNSTHLAKSRYKRGSKGMTFAKWKLDREAQHIIPATLAKKNKSLRGILDTVDNGIMLPALLTNNSKKITHRRPGHRDHKTYTDNVDQLIREVVRTHKNQGLRNNQTTLLMVMEALRPLHKLGTQFNYLDDIDYDEFKKAWNNAYGTNYPI